LKIVITDYRFPDIEQEKRAVEAAGGTLVAGQAVSEEQVAELCRDADGVLNARAPVTKRAIAEMECCRIIVRYGIGVDTIDVPAATARGIMVANVPDYCLDEVSDHAMALLLSLIRKIPFSSARAHAASNAYLGCHLRLHANFGVWKCRHRAASMRTWKLSIPTRGAPQSHLWRRPLFS
jgi:lactate dehydrogenase-like 2-hydroxyacid dehydrogenase